jgi:hypothetical protein
MLESRRSPYEWAAVLAAVLLATGQIPSIGVLDIGQCFGASFALRDTDGQRRTLRHEHAILMKLKSRFSDANPALLYDPKGVGEGLLLQQRYDVLQRFQDMIPVLSAQAQENASRRSAVHAEVGKVQVECNEGPAFGGADFPQLQIGLSPQVLVMDGQDIVACSLQKRGSFDGQVLVDFEFHAAAVDGIAITLSRANSAA